ncbi:hypothetical protein Scep_014285 [Stephania cephalantha]|uniref:CCHC-type domain-containing protein n=1 Tax=Stephania cephalantha TaxID=152367 RepID=A0AAP0P0F2_9MAGN
MSLQGNTHSANAAEVKNDNGNQFKTSQQNYANQSGVTRGYGNGNRGRGTGRFRGRGGFKYNNTSRPTCQICGKTGHTAAVCYYMTDLNFMGTNANGGGSSQQLLQSQSQKGAFLANQVPMSPQQLFQP